MIQKIIMNRNTLLMLSIILGLSGSWGTAFLKHWTLYILALVMVFSSISFDFALLKKKKFFVKTTLISFFLNYIIFGIILLSLAFLFIEEEDLINGFIVIAATPPGVAIIPFTFIFKGDTDSSLMGVLGVYLLAIAVSPFIIKFFTEGVNIDSFRLVRVTLEVIVIPIILSRLLTFKKVKPLAQKISGKVINLGFALIVYTVIGLNREAIFSELGLLVKISLIFTVTMFFSGIAYEFLFKNSTEKKLRISRNLMLTIKSSGYAAGTALAVFGDRSALPSAFLSVFVLLYLIVMGLFLEDKEDAPGNQ